MKQKSFSKKKISSKKMSQEEAQEKKHKLKKMVEKEKTRPKKDPDQVQKIKADFWGSKTQKSRFYKETFYMIWDGWRLC